MSDRRHDKRGLVAAWAERCFGWQIHSFILLNEQTDGGQQTSASDTTLHKPTREGRLWCSSLEESRSPSRALPTLVGSLCRLLSSCRNIVLIRSYLKYSQPYKDSRDIYSLTRHKGNVQYSLSSTLLSVVTNETRQHRQSAYQTWNHVGLESQSP